MKYLEKLKQLKKKKNNDLVEVIISYDNFEKINKIDLFDIVKKNDFISLKIKYFDYVKLRKLNLFENENDKVKVYIKTNRHKLIISTILSITILLIFVLNHFFVRKIEFKDKKYYNEEIYNYVLDYSKKIGKYYFFKDTINNISVKLREKYYQYAYIGLMKRGAKIIIEIEDQTIKDENNKTTDSFGKFISKADGIIEYIKIESGNVLVKSGDVVKKDQILVTSNLLYNENLYNKDKIVPLRGYVIAKTREYKVINVLKEEYVNIITNIKKKQYYISQIDSNNYANDNMFVKEYNIFKIGNFSLKKKLIFNEEFIKITRDFNEALEYAKYLIYIEYIQNFTYNEEEIISIDNIKNYENENEFYYVFMVNAKQNIAVYDEII